MKFEPIRDRNAERKLKCCLCLPIGCGAKIGAIIVIMVSIGAILRGVMEIIVDVTAGVIILLASLTFLAPII